MEVAGSCIPACRRGMAAPNVAEFRVVSAAVQERMQQAFHHPVWTNRTFGTVAKVEAWAGWAKGHWLLSAPWQCGSGLVALLQNKAATVGPLWQALWGHNWIHAA